MTKRYLQAVENTFQAINRVFRGPEALVFHLEVLANAGQPLPVAQGIEFHVRSSGNRPEHLDFITTIPVTDVTPVVTA